MIGAVLVVMLAGCAGGAGNGAPPDRFTDARHAMVASQIERRGVEDTRVLDAMRTVPRHEFVPPALRDQAYADRPLPIGSGQTISQPYVVAIMTELAHAGPDTTVLEIGTGSGYQAAVLAATGADVHSIEIVAPLYEQATETLARIGYGAIHLRLGDGRAGWPEAAPFDAIVVTAAAGEVPPALLEQLADGGRLVMPVGGDHEQVLEVHRRHGDRVTVEGVFPVRFVPLVGGD